MDAETLVRFWERVCAGYGGSCWVYMGLNGKGYGYMRVGRKRKTSAHRLSYEHFKGPIPGGLTIDHLCRNRACVNPDHLEAVTGRINTLRGMHPCAINARKTHCIRGHNFGTHGRVYTIRGIPYRRCTVCLRDKIRTTDRDRWRLRRAANIAKGLTWNGRPRATQGSRPHA